MPEWQRASSFSERAGPCLYWIPGSGEIASQAIRTAFSDRMGWTPQQIALKARRQLEAYPTLTWLDTKAEALAGQQG
jgi:hypothetical protein